MKTRKELGTKQLHEEQEATMGQSALDYFREMFCMSNSAYRFTAGSAGQILSQWSAV
jgi:hypothetical protein